MKKLRFPVTFAYVTGLILLGVAAVFFAIAWYFRLKPMEPDWGDWGTWAGAVGTIAGFAVAIATLWHNDKVRRQAEAEDRVAQARRVGITSTMEIEPAEAPWTAHQNAWTEVRGHPDIPSVEEQQYLDSYKGPWVGNVKYMAQNGTPYPLFGPVVKVDTPKLSYATPGQAPKAIPLPALIPGSTTSGSFSLEISVHPGEDMIPDLVALEFTDVWEDRWESTSRGCEKVVPVNDSPSEAR